MIPLGWHYTVATIW